MDPLGKTPQNKNPQISCWLPRSGWFGSTKRRRRKKRLRRFSQASIIFTWVGCFGQGYGQPRIHWAIERCADSPLKFDVSIFFVFWLETVYKLQIHLFNSNMSSRFEEFQVANTHLPTNKYAKNIGVFSNEFGSPPLTKPPEKTWHPESRQISAAEVLISSNQ